MIPKENEIGRTFTCGEWEYRFIDRNTQVYASIYDPESDDQKLMPVETEKEWKIIEIILEELQSEG